MRSRAAAAVRGAARYIGYDITRFRDAGSMEGALYRAAIDHEVSTVIDVGASDGRWSVVARAYFPKATYLLIEAQASAHEMALVKHAARFPGTHLVLAAAGHEVGVVHFDANDPFGGAAGQDPFGASDVIVPMTTVDAEVRRLRLSGPFLLKLDTHGFEREILLGAGETLADSSLLVLEAYNFALRPNAWRFHELCAHLDQLGFRPLDLVDVMRRPHDRVLWQFDLVFARSDRPEFARGEYGSPPVA